MRAIARACKGECEAEGQQKRTAETTAVSRILRVAGGCAIVPSPLSERAVPPLPPSG